MKVLLISDREMESLWEYYSPEKVKGVELIISCGDLKAVYLEFLVTMINKPLIYVHGNHDESYVKHAPEGCVCIDDDVVEINGLKIAGLGGSRRYRDGEFQYTERQMAKRCRKLKKKIKKAGGIDVFVSHAPMAGYGDMEDLPHQGFQCFAQFLEEVKPAYMFYGHVHKEYGNYPTSFSYNEGKTHIQNAYGYHIWDL